MPDMSSIYPRGLGIRRESEYDLESAEKTFFFGLPLSCCVNRTLCSTTPCNFQLPIQLVCAFHFTSEKKNLPTGHVVVVGSLSSPRQAGPLSPPMSSSWLRLHCTECPGGGGVVVLVGVVTDAHSSEKMASTTAPKKAPGVASQLHLCVQPHNLSQCKTLL